jgi:ArsR family transcriptional regulator, arsenate/arsenite/antimonite-responsive transcriptional repressor
METEQANSAQVEQLAAWLKVLAEPNRLRILELLMQGMQCNCEFGDRLQLAPNLISHHLSVLRQAGLIQAERDPGDSRWIYYSINRAALAALHAAFGTFFDPARLESRVPTCGPRSALVRTADLVTRSR